MWGTIQKPWLLYLKGVLFLVLGLTAAGMILLEHPDVRIAVLLAIAIWAFARAYYFAFYVVEKYADPRFRFAGLTSFALYLIGKRERD